MPFLYILKSLKDKKLYVGTCSDAVEQRLTRHNKGIVKSTRHRRPLTIVFREKFSTLTEARKKEWEFKYTPWGGKMKKKLASEAGGSSNGRTMDSGSMYLGSNPSPPASKGKRHKRTYG